MASPIAASLKPSSIDSFLRDALHDRVVGTLFGSALGDTIGLYTEFLSAASSAAAYPSGTFTLCPPAFRTPFILDTHRAPKPPGHWTDDTDHALLLLLAYLHTASTSSDNPPPLPTQLSLAARLRIWVSQGFRPLDTMPLGLGRLVSSVVSSKGFDVDPASVARGYWVRTGKRIAPNGSLMRTHPLGLMCLWREEEDAFQLAADMSRVTHADPRCVVACVIGTALVRGLVRGDVRTEEEVDDVVARAVGWVVGHGRVGADTDPELDIAELKRHVKPASLDDLQLDDPPTIGYVYKCLGSGVMLLRLAMRKTAARQGGLLDQVKIFEELVTDLIMRGGDADTNACFAGALLGAYLGYRALPDHWKHGFIHGDWLMGKAESLCQVLGVKEGQYDGPADKDTHLDGGRGVISQDEMEGRWMVLQQNAFKIIGDAAKANAKPSKGGSWTLNLPWQGKDKGKAKR
ncbi:ADP-ribosylglycohydrolase-domain-containing protein [Podospora didyma]|uniref:ADP-ribosylglycohydrolase-domain-containing protein n=1 Tax=Podospora didyma TaxID=330526 RepID=A0AAE0K0Y0_9PEZI|nr:ADP-ribosylglycohydrolase-domain-containing protein [Podospora didyma]